MFCLLAFEFSIKNNKEIPKFAILTGIVLIIPSPAQIETQVRV